MTKNTVQIDGWPVAAGVAPYYLAMAKAFDAQFPGIKLQVYSGVRTYEGQVSLFLSRYRVQWIGNGPYNDVRWWRGLRYVRHSGEGTVAQPGTSNHETGRSLDLRDTGADAGVASSFFAPRNVWLSQNCHRWGFTHTGKNFKEPWHFEQLAIADPWAVPAGSSSGSGGSSETPSTPEPAPTTTPNLLEIDMPLLYQPTSGTWKGKHFAIAPGYIKHIPGKESVQLFEDAHHTLGLKEILVSDKTFRTILGVNGIDSSVIDKNGYIFDYRTTERFVRGGSYTRGDDEVAKRSYRIAKKVGA